MIRRRALLTGVAALAAYSGLANAQSFISNPPIGPGSAVPIGPLGGAGNSPVFSPSQLPNLIGWWKADSGAFSDTGGTTPAVNGGLVSRLNDNSPSNIPLLASTAQPTYNTAVQNGLPVLTATGTQLMTATSFPMTATNALTVIVVVKIVAYTSFDRVISYGTAGDGSTGGFIAPILQSATSVQDVLGGAGNGSISTITTGFNQVCSIWDGTNNTIYIANVGATPVAQSANFLANNNLRIMANSGGNNMNGQIGEVIVYNRALTPTERGQINAYLLARWGV